jgi:uncharacterized membrane-anchored protein YjiN (DUF445 family)
MKENEEVIYITQNFRITENMKRKIANYSIKMGEGNKSEFLRTAVNFLISYFEDKDFFEMLEKKVFKSLTEYEITKTINTKQGKYSTDLIKANLRSFKNIPGSEEELEEIMNKITNEAAEELKDKYSDFIER